MSKENRVSDERLLAMLSAEIPLGMSVADARSIIEELLALRSKPVAGVEVKPLEWAPLSEYGPDAERASGILPGLYGVFIDQDSAAGAILSEWAETSDTLCTTAAKTLGRFPSFEEAKIAAEADYRNRIMSALLPKATAPVVSEPLTLDDDDLETILAIGMNEQSGRVTNYELKELVRVYRGAMKEA